MEKPNSQPDTSREQKNLQALDQYAQQQERSIILGKTAELAFFLIATPYYLSSFLSNWIGEKYLDEHPALKNIVMGTSLLTGATLAFREQIRDFGVETHKLVVRGRNFGRRKIAVANDQILTGSIRVYLQYRNAADKTTGSLRQLPSRCEKRIRIWRQKLSRS